MTRPPLGIPVAGEACGGPSVLELRDSGTTSLGLLALAPLRRWVEIQICAVLKYKNTSVQFKNINTIRLTQVANKYKYRIMLIVNLFHGSTALNTAWLALGTVVPLQIKPF